MSELVKAAEALHAGTLAFTDFMAVFKAAQVYAIAPRYPGIEVARGTLGEWVTVFSSKEAFARSGGRAWFSTTGADLLRLLPVGVQAVLDPYDRHHVTIPSSMAESDDLRPLRSVVPAHRRET
jgi:hypothetical protein